MKSILKIYRRYVCSACLLVVSLILINLAVFVVYLLKSNWTKRIRARIHGGFEPEGISR